MGHVVSPPPLYLDTCSTKKTHQDSPHHIAMQVNVVMITAQLSSMNSALYVASRSLVNLASTGRAPRFFAKTTKSGTPVYALVFSNALGLIAMLNYRVGTGKIFTYVVNIAGSATYIAWVSYKAKQKKNQTNPPPMSLPAILSPN